MPDLPMVSVVIPVYNVEAYVRATLLSVAQQTYRNLEAIIVDDGSTDGTASVVREFLRDARFKYLHQENRGPSAARNLGIRHAIGEFVAFLDGDDEWVRTKTERQVDELARRPDAQIVASNCTYMNEYGTPIGRRQPMRLSALARTMVVGRSTLYRRCPFSTCTVMMRRSWLATHGGFDESLRWAEDYDLWMRVAQSDAGIYMLQESLTHVRCRPGSLMSRSSAAYPSLIRMYGHALTRETDPRWRKILVRTTARCRLQMRSFQESEEALNLIPVNPWSAARVLLRAWSHYQSRRRVLLWAALLLVPDALGGARMRRKVTADMVDRHECRGECRMGGEGEQMSDRKTDGSKQ